jgi:ribosomal protein RSM22 (predicted rRNA methylase)
MPTTDDYSVLERTFSLREIHEQTGFPLRTLYKLVEDGELKVICPHGQKRGWRVTQSEWNRFTGRDV